MAATKGGPGEGIQTALRYQFADSILTLGSFTASIQSSVKNLSINPSKPKAGGKPPAIAESWEENEDSTSEDDSAENSRTPKGSPRRPRTSEYPGPPPPTPSSPQFDMSHGFSSPKGPSPDGVGGRRSRLQTDDYPASSQSRPEKTTSAASRMIAAGLGVRAPAKSEEQKQYDKAIRDKERKARDADKEAKRKAEESKTKAGQAMWDD